MILHTKKNSLFIIGILLSSCSWAQNLKVAVAANLQSVIKVLDADFKSKTGITVEPIIGSSGNLATQIKNGAPFDLFLSADIGFPEVLYNDGFSKNKPATYALGSLIICSTQNIDLKHWETALLKPDIKKVAIANPDIAPYGQAAKEVFTQLNLTEKLTPKLVLGGSIAQVNTYIATGVVSAGFTSLSFIYDSGQHVKLYWKTIDPQLYNPIEQGMIILKHAQGNNLQQAEKFYKYLLSSSAKAIFKKYGYRTE